MFHVLFSYYNKLAAGELYVHLGKYSSLKHCHYFGLNPIFLLMKNIVVNVDDAGVFEVGNLPCHGRDLSGSASPRLFLYNAILWCARLFRQPIPRLSTHIGSH